MREVELLSASRPSGLRDIAKALRSNRRCVTGFVPKSVWYVTEGIHGGPEALCMLRGDDPEAGYWYAHARPYRTGFAAYIIELRDIINVRGETKIILRFFERMASRQNFQLPRPRRPVPVFADATTFEDACLKLSEMIRDFDVLDHEAMPESAGDVRILEVWKHPAEAKADNQAGASARSLVLPL